MALFLKYLKRAWSSDMLMTMFSFFVRTGNLIFLLPLLLTRLEAGELSVFYLFQLVLGFTNILVSEMGLNFIRTLAFAQGGANEHDLKDLRNLTGSASADQIKQVSEQVLATIKRTGIYAALVVGFALLVFGTPALIKPISLLETPLDGWIAWGTFIVATVIVTYGGIYGYYMQGLGEVALFRRWEGLVLLISIIAGALSLLLGGGLLELTLAQQSIFILGILGRKYLSDTVLKKHNLLLKNRLFSTSIFAIVWAKTWRTAAGVFMHSGVFRLTGLLYAQSESAETMAAFLLTIKLMTVIVDFSKAPFYSKIPRMARISTMNRLDIIGMAKRGFFMSSMLFTAGVVFIGILGDPLLSFLGSNTTIVSRQRWALMGLAYFLERYAAMHLNVYTLSNHIIWHRVYLVSGSMYILLLLLLYKPLGLYAFPAAMLLSELFFSTWYCARKSFAYLQTGMLRFERWVTVPPLLLMLLYTGVVFCWGI